MQIPADREAASDKRLRLPLMRGVAVAVDETDGDGFDAVGYELLDGALEAGSSSGLTTLPSAAMRSSISTRWRRGTSGVGLLQVRSNISGMRMRPISSTSRKPRVVMRPVLAPLFCRIVLEADGRAVQDLDHIARRDAKLTQQREQSVDDRAARIVGRRRNLALRQDAVRRHQDDVGEGAVDIHGDPHTRLTDFAPHSDEFHPALRSHRVTVADAAETVKRERFTPELALDS